MAAEYKSFFFHVIDVENYYIVLQVGARFATLTMGDTARGHSDEKITTEMYEFKKIAAAATAAAVCRVTSIEVRRKILKGFSRNVIYFEFPHAENPFFLALPIRIIIIYRHLNSRLLFERKVEHLKGVNLLKPVPICIIH